MWIKVSIQPEDKIILNLYVPNNTASKHREQEVY